MPRYTTEAEVEKFLGDISITSGEADQAIDSAEKLIDKITGRNFKADESASARSFSGHGDRLLEIDDCVEITLVERGNNQYGDSYSTIDSDDYILEPTNYEKEGVPIKAVYLKYQYWNEGRQNHRITAKWGYSESAPDDIVMAATVIAAGMYTANRGDGGGIKSEKIGNYSISYGDDKQMWSSYERAMQILNQYKKYIL